MPRLLLIGLDYSIAFNPASAQLKIGQAHLNSMRAEGPPTKLDTYHLANTGVIRISDKATGIPESLKAKMFQPFFTTKTTGEGTGLDLSLSYDIMAKGHDGTITLESPVEKKALFPMQLFNGSLPSYEDTDSLSAR